MKKFLFLLVFTVMSLSSYAQDYNSSIGLRLGVPTSVTYKTFMNESSAIEIYGGLRRFYSTNAISANAAYLLHNNIESVEGLRWYYGAGAGVYIYSGNVAVNISGYLGLEYTFADLPIALSVDWVPTYVLTGGKTGFGAESGALAVRYILGRS